MSAPCHKCGRDAELVTVVAPSGPVAQGFLCGPCLAAAFERAAELREQFEALLEAGMSREAANREMIARIDGRQARA